MIIWINGTFGSGKTTTAYELQKRVKNSYVYDPERFGYVFMDNVPKEISKDDFQDYPLWREANYSLLKDIAKTYKGILIVPMTLTSERYFNEIIGNLIKEGIEIKHFTLCASKSTIEKRLRTRWEGKSSWAYQQMNDRMRSLTKDIFKQHIQTDALTIDEVVERIAQLSGISLQPDNRTSFRKLLDRSIIKLREIRILK